MNTQSHLPPQTSKPWYVRAIRMLLRASQFVFFIVMTLFKASPRTWTITEPWRSQSPYTESLPLQHRIRQVAVNVVLPVLLPPVILFLLAIIVVLIFRP